MFCILARKAIGDIGLTKIILACALRIDLFEMGCSPRMHQTSNNRYNPNGYGSLQCTPIACGLEEPKRHGKRSKSAFLLITNQNLVKSFSGNHFVMTRRVC